MEKVAIVDYGMGNLHSVKKAFEKASPRDEILITRSSIEIDEADKIILPGVGAIKDCIKSLRDLKLDQLIVKNIKTKPLLAICVGMQILLDFSEENNGTKGLGLIKGDVKKFNQDDNSRKIKIPHMGWNTVEQVQDHFIWSGIPNNSYFYFVHSYSCELIDKTVGITEHGRNFSAAIAHKNLFAVQFHPEKSQDLGLEIFKNFSKWKGEK
jgi:glutamine amidotransferase